MPEIKAFRLLPVPMYLGDPRWRRSWRQKPCLVFETTEARARAAASEFFSTVDRPLRASIDGHPWDDPHLVVCEVRSTVSRSEGAAVITDFGGEAIHRADHEGA